MVSHIVLVNFTAKGVEHIKDSPSRAAKFTEHAKSMGVQVEGLYWTAGHHDGVLLLHAPDDATASAATLILAKGGYVQTQTLRAFDHDGAQAIIAKL